jgi:hypothetical protein
VLGMALVFGGAQLVAAAWQGVTYRCLVDGPTSPLAEVSERAGVVSGSASVWPLGRACEWARADRTGTVTTHSGSRSVTVITFAIGAVGLGLVVAPAVAGSLGRRESGQPA